MEQILISAISGAIAAGVVTGIIEFLKWFLKRRSERLALQTGFYFEIENHKITELGKDSDGSPNFSLTMYNDTVYRNNLSLAMTLLNSKFIQDLIFYYSTLTSALEYQKILLEITNEINDKGSYRDDSLPVRVAKNMEIEELMKKREGIRGTIRLMLGMAQFTRVNLLSDLKKNFKEDPSKREFINVLPKHQEWLDKIRTEQLKNPNQH